MLSAGKLIWISCRPLLRLIFCVSSGFAIAKADIFPPVAAAGAGQILLNITLPCLMFSKIVPAFTSQNVNALGPLILVALLYEIIGAIFAWIIKQFFWVPHRFRYGFIVAGGWGNVGDIPTAVIMSITGAAPFRGVQDQNLAVAYISAFILVFMVTLFPFGGHKLVAWDFAGPDVEHEEVREAMRLKRKVMFHSVCRLWRKKSDKGDREPVIDVPENTTEKETPSGTLVQRKQVSFDQNCSKGAKDVGILSPSCSLSPTEVNYPISDSPDGNATMTRVNTLSNEGQPISQPGVNKEAVIEVLPTHVTQTSKSSFGHYINRERVLEFFKALLTPSSITILTSFPIALIPKIKALFVEVPGTYMPPAPDGQPPLAFLLDATTFVGAASVPLGLVCLGSSIARLNMPRKGEWKNQPMGAIIWLSIAKMVIMPVVGVLMCQGLTQAGVISKDDIKHLTFFSSFFSCLPTATVHVLLTQVYSGTGSAEHLSPFLIPQYILMFISMTALTAYTIQLIF
ncbi:Protein ECM3 [Psilocybe cubensis]|uniref:Protein ECM3 n=2 Tax=Psilocybe cubensis TaxID=181762 RepID=A0ACB8H1A8_PSICU|nr:Protein ECM3 [Psilocybe cubensis]KAH9481484.1 Protein ECM3 [Psilocybe cubensis]